MTTPATRAEGAKEPEQLPLGQLQVADAPHHQRRTDTDPRAAAAPSGRSRIMFGLSMVLAILSVVAFFAFDTADVIFIPGLGEVGLLHVTLGVALGGAIFLIGAGAIHWAKKLMVDVEVVADRHEMKSDAESTEEAAAVFETGAEQSGFTKYPIIRRTLIGAMALLPLPLIVPLRDLWATPPGSPAPGAILSETMWTDGLRIVIRHHLPAGQGRGHSCRWPGQRSPDHSARG